MAKNKGSQNKENNYTADHYKLNTKAVDRLVTLGIIKGDEAGRFAPRKFATRAETAVLLQRLIAFRNTEGR